MPKQTLKIRDFSGGLNTLHDPRDIPANSFSEFDSANIDDPGRIKLSGGISPNSSGNGYTADYTDDTNSMAADHNFLGWVKPGMGLYQYSSDREVIEAVDNLKAYTKIAGTITDTATNSIPVNITALHRGAIGSASNNKLSLYDDSSDFWYQGLVDIGGTATSTELSEPLMYVSDGGLRVVEGNFDISATNRLVSYINRNHFDDGTHGNVFDGWFVSDQKISNNPNGSTNLIVQCDTAVSETGVTDINDIKVGLWQRTNTKAFGWSDTANSLTWTVGISFVYDETQESPLVIKTSPLTVPVDQDVTLFLYMMGSDSSAVYFNPRVTAIKVYLKQSTSSSIKSHDWYLGGIWELDKDKGGRRPQDSVYDTNGWSHNSGVFSSAAERWVSPPSVSTYRTETGRRENENIDIRYKTAVIANGRVYAGNVSHPDLLGGVALPHPDRMLKSSKVNGKMMLDVFPSSSQLDLAINDGDEIIKLAFFMGKIIQFKRKKIYVINVSGASEQVESTHEFLGIDHQSQVCTTASGIMWVCEKGVMLYNGQSITNLIDAKISRGDWDSFFTASNNPCIGYDPRDAKVIISKGSVHGSVGDVYIFDMKLKAFSYKTGAIKTGANSYHITDYTSNFITDHNGNIMWYNAYESNSPDDGEPGNFSEMKKWNRTSQASSTFMVATKDFDFEEPSSRKKIYKVYITYKCPTANSGVFAQYATNGTGTKKQFSALSNAAIHTTDGVSYAQLNGGVSDWTIAELRPATSSEANNIKSIQLFVGAIRSVDTAARSAQVTGSGYDAGPANTNGGTGSGLICEIEVDGNGGILDTIIVTNAGQGYTAGDTLTIEGGDGAGRMVVTGLSVAQADFEINDITIVYRPKRIK